MRVLNQTKRPCFLFLSASSYIIINLHSWGCSKKPWLFKSNRYARRRKKEGLSFFALQAIILILQVLEEEASIHHES